MTDNHLSIWNALSKTDPAQTKAFSRSGGFKGTAIKPIYSIKRMTEQFGPCGKGWGMTKPEFQTISSDGEILVYCTAGLWHGTTDNLVYGVGGDKVTAKRQSGAFNSDEAFKAAYTDALSNAMKMIGVGADVHMGLFDDHKYVREITQEFREAEKAATTPFDEGAPDPRDAACNRIIGEIRDSRTEQELLDTWKRSQGEIVVMSAEQMAAVTKAKDEMKTTLTRRAA